MKKDNYGWAVCAACTLLLFITMGVANNGFSVFMPYMMEQKGLTYIQTSNLVTFRFTVAFLALLVIGKFYEIFSVRVGIFIAALCSAISFGIFAFAESYAVFIIGACFVGMGFGFGTMVPASILINNWFIDKRGLAIGIVAAGSGMATMIMPGISTYLVENHSMRVAFGAEGIGMLVLDILIFLIVRNSPEEAGRRPVTSRASEKTEKSAERVPPMTRSMWILMIAAIGIMGAMANPGFAHITVLFKTGGFSAGNVALVFSIVGGVMMAGKILLGSIADHLGGFKSTMAFGVILVTACMITLMIPLHSVPIAMTTGALFGLGFSVSTVGPTIWANDLGSQEEFPKAIRWFTVAYNGGGLCFSTVPGIFAEHFGSYIQCYVMFGIMMMLVMVMVSICYIRKNSNMKQNR